MPVAAPGAAVRGWGMVARPSERSMANMTSKTSKTTTSTTLLPIQPEAMTPAQLAAVSYLARYTGRRTRSTPLCCAAITERVS